MQHIKHHIAVLTAVLLLLVGCSSPFGESAGESQTGVRVRLQASGNSGAGSRTVLPDIGEQNLTWQVTMTRDEDELERTATGTGGAVTLTDLPPGTYDIVVKGRNSSDEVVATGDENGIVVQLGQMEEINVQVALVSGDPGSFSLTVEFPASLEIDSIYAVLEPQGGGDVHEFTVDSFTSDGSTRLAILQHGDLGAGMYHLFMNFLNTDNETVSIFIEAITIINGLHSDRWVGPDGQLLDRRSFSTSDFQNTNSQLGGLEVFGGILDQPFDPGITEYNLISVGSDVHLVSYYGDAGQRLTKESNESGTLSWQFFEPIVFTGVDEIFIMVTAPNGIATTTYEITVVSSDSAPHQITYNANGGHNPPALQETDQSGSFTVAAPPGVSRVRDGISMRFTGWNTERNGGGDSYNPGDTQNISADITLYAQWNVIGGTGPGGGFVFYDKENYDDGWRYMEVAKESAGTSVWLDVGGEQNPANVGHTLNVFGQGRHNSLLMQSHPDHVGSAAAVAAGYPSVQGYTDWFLPTKQELKEVFSNNKVPDTIPLMIDDTIWTSVQCTEIADVTFRNYPTGFANQGYNGAIATKRTVLPVRAFAGHDQRHVVVYHPNGATGTPPLDLNFYPSGSTATLLDKGELEGDFAGWHTHPEGNGEPYAAGSTLPITEDTVLYAQWNEE
ncbi:InlB B-repeat-containing protein [Spirochaeta africana]|uniref:Conserved repeat protein (List_Bact_rpt) n=1 Tax=Spirochaeta africana (strain ATCC 700263 / DSM 8902 / Z-7692) TaxID=889378 RepID=H9UGD0_SPIAZ|nr:InlB B-repeat-containing protein [Spirochaeta africana]AFG36573.1 conserved repeat protein (List_Bact_rpt) [Spirochaeta africana DSM 8902]